MCVCGGGGGGGGKCYVLDGQMFGRVYTVMQGTLPSMVVRSELYRHLRHAGINALGYKHLALIFTPVCTQRPYSNSRAHSTFGSVLTKP